MRLEHLFPNLGATDHRITSPSSPKYSCIAWAAGDATNWWWPDSMELAYWPTGIPREETIESFVALFESLGFESCGETGLEQHFDKVALFAKGNQPTHAARQLESGNWTSKLGPLEDIEHKRDGLVGEYYGSVVRVFKRLRRE